MDEPKYLIMNPLHCEFKIVKKPRIIIKYTIEKNDYEMKLSELQKKIIVVHLKRFNILCLRPL